MPKDSFEEFLLAEYEHIADAHFEAGKQLSKFFNFYLFILAAPVALITLIEKSKLDDILVPPNSESNIKHNLAATLFLIIAVFGFFICWVLIKLLHDSIIYARTVNGIRNYFYKEKALLPAEEKQIRVLPRDVNRPDFHSAGYLGIIVVAFAIVNTAFLGVSMYILMKGEVGYLFFIILAVFLFLHIILHIVSSNKKKRKFS